MAPRVDQEKTKIVAKGITSAPDNLKTFTGLVQAQPGKMASRDFVTRTLKTVEAPKPVAKTIGKIASIIKQVAPKSNTMGGELPAVTVKATRIYKGLDKPKPTSVDSVNYYGTGRGGALGYDKYTGKSQKLAIKDVEDVYKDVKVPSYMKSSELGQALSIKNPKQKQEAVRRAIEAYGQREGDGKVMEPFVMELIRRGKLKEKGEQPAPKK